MARLHMTLDHEVDVLEHQFARNAVTHHARAWPASSIRIRIEVTADSGEVARVRGERILLAVGTRPYRPPDMPFDGEHIVDSDEIVESHQLPRSLTVVGAGVIGVEYATIFSALDVAVTLVDAQAQLPRLHRPRADRGFHPPVARSRHGDAARLQGRRASNSRTAGRRRCWKAGGGCASEMLLYAAGRVGATDTLNLAAAGLAADERGRLSVDPQTFQTEVPHIYAAGDAIGFPSLASTSMEQGRIAACHAFGMPMPPAPEFFPYGIYSVPEISTVGMSEEEVRKRDIPYECGIARFRETSRGHIMGLERRHDEDDLLASTPAGCSACISSARARPNWCISARRC